MPYNQVTGVLKEMVDRIVMMHRAAMTYSPRELGEPETVSLSMSGHIGITYSTGRRYVYDTDFETYCIWH